MDFTSKAIWVLDWNRTLDPEGSLYSVVVFMVIIRIALTHESLNVLDVVAADIRNAYLQEPSSQKDYIICSPDFGF